MVYMGIIYNNIGNELVYVYVYKTTTNKLELAFKHFGEPAIYLKIEKMKEKKGGKLRNRLNID